MLEYNDNNQINGVHKMTNLNNATTQELIQWVFNGMITEAEATIALDNRKIRGEFSSSDNEYPYYAYIGFDYDSQEWIEAAL